MFGGVSVNEFSRDAELVAVGPSIRSNLTISIAVHTRHYLYSVLCDPFVVDKEGSERCNQKSFEVDNFVIIIVVFNLNHFYEFFSQNLQQSHASFVPGMQNTSRQVIRGHTRYARYNDIYHNPFYL